MGDVSAAVGAAVDSSAAIPDQPLDRSGREYFNKLLKNIQVMLNYVDENGIIVPDDLNDRISRLFSSPDSSGDRATIKAAQAIRES